MLLARAFAPEDATQVAGLAAFVGHCFPVWLGFKGGKGVATYLGVIGAIGWPMGLAACGIWLVVAAVSRYSSMATLVMVGWLPLVMGFTGYGHMSLIGLALCFLIFARHWGNIKRLRAGTENKIGAKTA